MIIEKELGENCLQLVYKIKGSVFLKMANEKSIRQNSLPAGGVQQTTDPTKQRKLPTTRQMKEMSEMFADISLPNSVRTDRGALIPGQQITLKVQNTGLGERLALEIKGSISLANTAVGAQDVSLSYEFPFNLISNLLTQFNGSTVIDSLSGYELLGVMMKRDKNVIIGGGASAGAKFSQNILRVNGVTAWATSGTNLTVKSTGNTLTGVEVVTVAGASTGVLNFGMVLEIPFTLRKDLLLGLLPMQNPNIYATIQITSPNVLGTTPASPLFVAGAVPATLTNSANAITVDPTYYFWSIPSGGDPRLYQYLCSHNYMLLSQSNLILSTNGKEALQFPVPNNFYLLSAMATLRDNTGTLVDVYSKLDNLYLSYNNTARVARMSMATRFAEQYRSYNQNSPLGQMLFDCTDVERETNGLNMTKWLDMYKANNPLFIADVDATVASGTYSVLREQLVPADVVLV